MEKDETVRIIAEQLANKGVTPQAIAGYEMIQTAVMALQMSADKDAAENYVEITLGGLHAPFDRAAIHLIRPEGKSPHELREHAERELGGASVEIRQALSAVEDRDRALRQSREKIATIERDRDAALSRVKELEAELARWQPSIDVLKNTPPSRLDELLAALDSKTTEAVTLTQDMVDALLKEGAGNE